MKILSYSALQLLMQCPRAYSYRYIDKQKPPGGPPLYIGSLTETALDHHNIERVAGRKGLPLHEVPDFIAAQADRIFEREEYTFPREDLPKYVDESQALALKYIADLAPKYEPIAVQHKFFFPIPDSEYWVMGYMDALAKGGIIVESKTSMPAWWTDRRVKLSMQPTIYAFARYYETGEIALPRYYVVEKRTGNTLILDAPRSLNDMEWILGAFTEAVKLLKAGAFMPCHPESIRCNAGYCAFWKPCKEPNHEHD